MNKIALALLLIISCFFTIPMQVGACAKAVVVDFDSEYEDEAFDAVGTGVYDPLEGFNRVVHSFNDGVIDYVARPLYKGYVYVTPSFFRTGVKNVFYNALFPVRFTNNLLQGKGKAAGVEMSRFVLNTTAGLGGMINVAKNHKTIVPVDEEDLGQTFGVWGMGEGFYLVLPFFGPSSLRDTVGRVGDHFLDPVSYIQPTGLSIGLGGSRAFNDLDGVLDTYDDLKRSSIEPYSSFRDAYIQHRRAKISR